MVESLADPPACLSYDAITLQFSRILPGDVLRGFVPAYHFRILNEEGVGTGHINFRVGDTEHVRLCAGHIGYEVREPFRGRGYALQACLAIAPFVRTVYPEVIITTDPDNYPSIRIIERLGACFIDETPVPVHDPHYQRGSRIKRRYLWNL